MFEKKNIKKIHDYLWEIPKTYRNDMKVPARIYSTVKMLDSVLLDKSLDQLVNVATLPGIQKAALVMPDVHEGYGFPIGGVAAMEFPNGAISPGGIGYDINCGVRLLKSDLVIDDIKSSLEYLAKSLFRAIPSGVGRHGRVNLVKKELDEVLSNGINWAVKAGYASNDDAKFIESNGCLPNANPDAVSQHAKNRGHNQLGTMGAGNHFVEVDVVDKVFDNKTAQSFGLFENQIVVLVHTGSRGLGHQVATDYIRIMLNAMPKYNISLPDRELACAPFSSREGQDYFNAMAAAANFAWVNRQLIAWEVRIEWEEVFSKKNKLSLLYDVAHNIAKIEKHKINGKKEKLILHRKGATRAFGPGNPDLVSEYQESGQPVIIPGSMGSSSYVLAGTNRGMEESFGSSCHGAGRVMSRHFAKKQIQGKKLIADLEKEGIIIKTGSVRDLPEEAPFAYKDIHDVVDVVHMAGIARKVARLRPVVVIKG